MKYRGKKSAKRSSDHRFQGSSFIHRFRTVHRFQGSTLHSQVPGVPGCIHRFRGSRVPPLFTGSTSHSTGSRVYSQVPGFQCSTSIHRFHLLFTGSRVYSQVPGFQGSILHSQVPPPIHRFQGVFTGSGVPPLFTGATSHSQVPGVPGCIHRFRGSGVPPLFTGSTSHSIGSRGPTLPSTGSRGFRVLEVPPPIHRLQGCRGSTFYFLLAMRLQESRKYHILQTEYFFLSRTVLIGFQTQMV